MGRRESELNPQATPLEQFAHDLRELRRKAGNPSYRSLSQVAHYSASALSTAANGRSLPSLAVLESYVRACGGDEQEWRGRWHELNAKSAATTPDSDGSGSSAVRSVGIDATPDAPPSRMTWRGPGALVAVPTALALGASLAAVIAVGGLRQKPAPSPPVRAVTGLPAPGTACWPDVSAGHLLPEPTGQEPDAATETPGEMDFAAATTANHYWSSWLPKPPPGEPDNLVEEVSTEPAYQGKSTLRVEVNLGFAQIGSTHMPGLESRDTVTMAYWYGGQGSAIICPFIQQSGTYVDYYPEVRELYVTPNTTPGWHTYQWRVPDLPSHRVQGTAIEIVNTGVTPFVFCLGAFTW